MHRTENPENPARLREPPQNWTCSVVRFCESTARQIEALEASVRFRSGPQYCVVAQRFLEHEIHILRVPGSNPGYATGQLAEWFRRRIVVPVYVGSTPTLPPIKNELFSFL